MKKLQGRVVCATNDKTVAVEVVASPPTQVQAPRPQEEEVPGHDPENLFKVGDFVQLEKSRPSKTKTFLAVPVAARNAPKPVDPVPSALLDLPPSNPSSSPRRRRNDRNPSSDSPSLPPPPPLSPGLCVKFPSFAVAVIV
uniref:Uncharacterized protein n=1 Tax=Ananas comosus var. bracteatus TaxID=296719 RepID=A0A6V7NGS0_ANACO|nr:unnamed protein product [Ananas comosus var. bracteatus]